MKASARCTGYKWSSVQHTSAGRGSMEQHDAGGVLAHTHCVEPNRLPANPWTKLSNPARLIETNYMPRKNPNKKTSEEQNFADLEERQDKNP